jgi:hypothetical protein
MSSFWSKDRPSLLQIWMWNIDFYLLTSATLCVMCIDSIARHGSCVCLELPGLGAWPRLRSAAGWTDDDGPWCSIPRFSSVAIVTVTSEVSGVLLRCCTMNKWAMQLFWNIFRPRPAQTSHLHMLGTRINVPTQTHTSISGMEILFLAYLYEMKYSLFQHLRQKKYFKNYYITRIWKCQHFNRLNDSRPGICTDLAMPVCPEVRRDSGWFIIFFNSFNNISSTV